MWEQKLCHPNFKNLKDRLLPKNKKLIKNFLPKYTILSSSKALIHSIWTTNEKVMDNLVFKQSKHLLEKKNL